MKMIERYSPSLSIQHLDGALALIDPPTVVSIDGCIRNIRISHACACSLCYNPDQISRIRAKSRRLHACMHAYKMRVVCGLRQTDKQTARETGRQIYSCVIMHIVI